METKEIMNEQLTKIADGWMQKTSPTFDDLSESIIQTHQSASYYPQIGELLESRIVQTSEKLIVPCSISATLSPKSEKSATVSTKFITVALGTDI